MNLFYSILFSLTLANTVPNHREASSYSSDPQITLNLTSTLVSGNIVKIGYEIPFPGYIEFHLFSPEGERIWADYSVRGRGEHFQAISRKPLESGQSYSFEFFYKGKKFSGKFTNN